MKAIILRHAERPKLPSELGVAQHGLQEDDAPITDAGKDAAFEVGARLKGAIRAILTSPVRRCVETAASLARGAGIAADSIAVVGFLSSDFFGRFSELHEQSKKEAVKRLLSGEAVPGFKHPKAQCAQVLRLIEENTRHGSALYVTHDWWMALLLSNSTLAFERHGYDIWPQFLERFEIDFRARSIFYRGEEYSVSMRIADPPSQGGE